MQQQTSGPHIVWPVVRYACIQLKFVRKYSVGINNIAVVLSFYLLHDWTLALLLDLLVKAFGSWRRSEEWFRVVRTFLIPSKLNNSLAFLISHEKTLDKSRWLLGYQSTRNQKSTCVQIYLFFTGLSHWKLTYCALHSCLLFQCDKKSRLPSPLIAQWFTSVLSNPH